MNKTIQSAALLLGIAAVIAAFCSVTATIFPNLMDSGPIATIAGVFTVLALLLMAAQAIVSIWARIRKRETDA